MDSLIENWCYDEKDCDQKFHDFCSHNIQLSNEGRAASRVASFRGLCFSAKALRPEFPFIIQIRRVEHGWTGRLRLGLTTIDPSQHPNLDSADFNNETFLVPLPCKPNSSTAFPMETDAIFGISFKSVADGLVQPFALINNQQIPFRDEPVEVTPGRAIYAVVDLFGVTKSAEVIPIKRFVPRLSTLCEQTFCRTFRDTQTKLPMPKQIRQSLDLRFAMNPVVV
ncbi:hypothetical protein M3Y94_00583500 [Aphelenchoides besseyi]|nr:hypothetical protein M3Y94_00583500 [Aphelenchoides besseyi]KAI6222053.1 NHR domain-containing protein [Aphelenchoides besseyi]